ncbi:MAG: hypothetical protein M1819_004109 [Sarea resinae]|nr:MAG: hypothetical protein M1819_004109 [Sarea resinae]
MLVSLTVGKVDAGVAVLLTEDKRLIEFPSILLPPDISSGSIVDITVSHNFDSEAATQKAFSALQSEIYTTFGTQAPAAPVLRCRNATQTSVVLEWDPIQLAAAELRSLSLYRNGSKAGNIPRPHEQQSTKISGLAVDQEYVFHLVLKTSAGTYTSEKLHVHTHKMTDLSGITVTPGIMPASLRESLETAVQRIGAKLVDTVRIDTTHFVCMEGRGQAWEKAVELNIPVVRPEWVEGCEREGRLVGVRGYYLNADPRMRQFGQVQQQQHDDRPSSQASSQRTVPIQQQAQHHPQQPSESRPSRSSPQRPSVEPAPSEASDEPKATTNGTHAEPTSTPNTPAPSLPPKDTPPTATATEAPSDSSDSSEDPDEDDEEEDETHENGDATPRATANATAAPVAKKAPVRDEPTPRAETTETGEGFSEVSL